MLVSRRFTEQVARIVAKLNGTKIARKLSDSCTSNHDPARLFNSIGFYISGTGPLVSYKSDHRPPPPRPKEIGSDLNLCFEVAQ